MAEFIHKAGTGSLLTNLKKASEKAPDYNGKFVLSRDLKAGDTLYLGCWERRTDKGVILMLSEDSYRQNKDEEKKQKEAEINSQYPRELNNTDLGDHYADDSEVPFN